MKTNHFPKVLSNYFLKYIPERTGYSTNTIKSYRDTFVLLFRYQTEHLNKPISKINFNTINRKYIEGFLTWLETEKKYSVSSLNQRLAGIHSFFKYVQMESPEIIDLCTSILSIKSMKVPTVFMNYLSIEAIKILLSLPDRTCQGGRRDLALLTLLYDTGARVQEIADLTFGDIRNKKPATIKITGKGNKTRIVPIMPQTLDIINAYLGDCEKYNALINTNPVFYNNRKEKLTRAGISYVLNKYTSKAQQIDPYLFPQNISPHTLRHSKGMHLLEGGVNLIYIRDFLGHTSVTTTEIYAKSNPEIKRKAIENVNPNVYPPEMFSNKQKVEMSDWLKTII